MVFGATLAAVACASARAGVDLSVLDKSMAGPRAQVLVLGSVHLSGMKELQPGALDPVLERLAAFKPDVITIEGISGEGCDLLARHPAVYPPDNIEPFCANPDAARKATGLDVPSAIAEVNRTLAQWPERPTAAQRRKLKLQARSVADQQDLLRHLTSLLDDSEVLIGLDDPQIYNAANLKPLLLSAYNRNRVLIGPSAPFIAAGSPRAKKSATVRPTGVLTP